MSSTAPPVLAVGVTGHRLDKLSDASIARVTPAIGMLLQKLQDIVLRARSGAAAPTPSALKVISPLAEGADRLIAGLALERGAGLIAPLPFARELYIRDFSSAASKTEFKTMLDRAENVLEMNGDGATEESRKAAYAAVGVAVADNSDLLLALWDGDAAHGHGGTAEIVAYARRIGKPVLWLPTTAAKPQLLLTGRTVADRAVDAFLHKASEIVMSRTAGPS